MATLGKNQVFEIKNGDGTSFHNLVLRKSAVESIVMSLGDKISGDVYYKDNTLSVTMHEYITYNGVNYMLINPPTIVREGVVSDNSELRGMTKYSFVFYHPMCQLSNFPFTDVAVTNDETRYLSESKTFSWIGKPADFVAKMNKNLDGTEWIVEISSRFPQDKLNELSDVIPFDNATIADACKTFYDTWGVPYVVDKVASTEASYATGKRFKLVMGLPSNEIYENAAAEQQQTPFVFQMGHGVGLKNNSRTPRNNKIITRISGYGSENNIPYGYPQVRWYGTAGQSFTYGDHAGVYTDVTIGGVHFDKVVSYPIYKGILNGEYVELIKHPFTRTHLMPSVYRTTLFNKISLYDDLGEVNTDYDPDITLVDYYDAIYSAQYPYPNTINLQAPSYESHEFEDEKPELGEAHIISATPLNNDLTPASSWDDSMDDEGNYKQSYFQMVLPQLSFDLYACASITEEMQINMRSGACLGCTFTVQVDWDDYKQNFYDEEGIFAPNGSQRDLTKYPKSNQGSISLVLQKDNSTFGTLMPNMYQYPKGETSSGAGDGDTFVILGISLPESYIFAAEWRLDADMKSYMLENNVHYFDYPLKFDEDFLFHNENILSQIRPNTVVRFNYAGQTQALFVKQITIKYGEQPLPQYDITLTDNVEVVLNQIGQVAEDVEKLSTLIAILRQSYGKNVWNELAKKLSKTQDDTAAGYITMLKGLQVGANFVPDILGEGGVLRMRDDGKVELVTDILYARVKAYFDTVEIREYKHTGGNRIASVAGNKICRVAWFNSSNVELEQTQANLSSVAYFRCYFRASDGEDTVKNNWIVGDLAYCHITSIVNSSDNPEQKGLNQKHLWRLVIGRNTEGTLTEDGEAYIDLSNRATETISGTSYTGYQSGSDAPEAQDDIIQLGNVNDTTRQGAIVEFVTGTDAPSYQIYQGINSFSLNNKNQIGFGYNTGTGRAYLNVYGDFRFGARPNTQGSYLEYNSQTGALNIKAHVEFTNTDQELDTLVQNHQRDDSYDDTEVRGLISGLQEQIDGQIETWFYNYSPVNVDASGAPTSNVPLNVAPYSDWTTDNDKIAHLGDTFTNNSTGYCWRFSRNSSTNAFEWVIIEDSAVITALQNAARAQDTADHKRRVFICDSSHQTPTPPYDAGDLWVNVKYPWATGATYNDEILKCVTSKASGSFAIADWSLANGYTAKLNNFVNNTYSPFAQNIQTQVDKKAETWRQATNPASSWTTEAEKAKHVGDLWMDTANGKKTYIYQNTASAGATPVYDWVAQDVPDEVFDKIDGKAAIYVGWEDWIVGDVSQLKDKDLYIPNTDHNPYKANKVYRWRASDSTWNEISYTDDTAFNNYINAFLNGTGASGDSATAAAIQKAIAGALGSGTIVDGGLLLTSLIGMRKNIGTTESPVYETWAGISGQYDDWSGSTHAKGHGIAAWYGGAMVDKEDVQTLPASYAKSLFRFDGSGYLASGNITWDENGSLTIKNITTLSDSNNNNILNELATFNSAFTFGTSGQGSTTALYITPNVPFESLYIGTSNANKKEVATRKWVDDHYVSTAFFRQLFRAFKPNATAGQADIEVEPNTIDVTISNIKAMVGFWTEQYVSALGNSSDGGGGGGGASVLYGLNDVTPNATGDGVMGAQDGYVLTYNGSTHHWYAAATAETYVLPQATANALGGIKIGYAASGKNYAIALDTNGKAYVNVPWTDTTYTLVGLMGSTAIGGTTQPIYWNGSAFANTTYTLAKSVPADAKFTDTTYSFSNADATLAWSTRTKIATTGGTDIYVTLPANPDTWRNIFLDGTEKLTTAINTKGLNFVGDDKTTISFLAAGTEEGQSGNANYATLKISSTWRGIQDNLTSDSTTDSLSAKQGKNLKSSITTLEGYFTKGVAKKAEQLNTSRTLWGQNFNGTANVSGNMTGVGNITMSANDGTYIKIGDIYIGYDSTNSAIEIYKLDENDAHVAANLYAHGAISALGQGVDGGGGGQGDVTWALLADNTDTRQIALSHLTTALAGYSTTSHTHTTTIAVGASTDTSQLTLAHGTKYKLTAGETSFVFTMPSGYSLPTASSSTLGGVKVGSTLAISSGVLNLATSGVTAGTYKRVTVDAYGRVTAGDDTDSNTWRNIYLGGTSKVGTGTDTKALNFVAGSNVTISYEAAGTGDGKSGSADYFNIKIAATDTTYSAATQSAAGLMSAADKKKLDGVAESANNYSLPLATSSARGGVKIGYTTDVTNRNYAVQLSSEKMYVNVPWTDTTYSVFVGSGSTAAVGLVPKPSTTAGTTKFLREDATWVVPDYPTNYIASDTSRTANTVLAAPNGQNGAATFRVLVAADIPDLSDTYATDSRVDTLEGYFTNGVANKAEELNTSRTLWGQSFNGTANVSGAISNTGDITPTSTATSSIGSSSLVYSNVYANALYSAASTALTLGINGTAYATINTSGNLLVGTTTSRAKVTVNGSVYPLTNNKSSMTLGGSSYRWYNLYSVSGNFSGAVTMSSTLSVTGVTTLSGLLTANGGIVVPTSNTIKIGDAYLAYDSENNAIKVYKLDENNEETAANFYALGAISALGQGVDGGGGGQGDVTWALLASDSDTRQIALSHLTTALSGYSTTSHTHTTTIAAAASGDTNQLTLAHGTKYKLTAGGTSYIFTMPSDNNSWRNVYVAGTEKLTTATNTKAINFVAGNNVSISFAAAGTGSGQSGNANYGTLTISATDTTYTLAGLMGSTAIGGTTQPIYWNGSAFANTSYTLGKSVPSNAVFTDTTYSAGTGLSLSGTTFSVKTPSSGAYFDGTAYVASDGVMEIGRYIDFHPTSASTLDYNIRLDAGNGTTARIFTFPDSSGTLLSSGNSSVSLNGSTLTVKINGTEQSLTNTNTTYSASTGLSLSGTAFSVSSTYQTYISHGESAYNSLGNYLPLVGGKMTGEVTMNWGSASSDQFINFKASDNIVYSIGIRRPANTYGLCYVENGSYYNVWHQGNLTKLSQLTNDSGYITSSGSCNYATSAGSATSAGNADTCDGLHVHTGRNYDADKIVRTDSNGHIQCGYINSSGDEANNSSPARVWGTNGSDSYMRTYLTSALSVNTANRVGDGMNYIYCTSNEVNFGGTYNTDTIEFGATAKDSKPKPTVYKFGGSSATAAVFCNNIYTPNISSVAIGSGTYTTMRWGLYSDHYEFEFPNTDDTHGVHIPIYMGWRGGVYALTITSTGDIVGMAGVTALSDARHKQVIRDTNLSVEQIANMPSVIFKWTDEKHDNDLHVGTLAQNWQQILPEVVNVGNDKEHTLSLSYGVAALVAAITTARKVVDHEARIKALEKENKELREEISRLKIA